MSAEIRNGDYVRVTIEGTYGTDSLNRKYVIDASGVAARIPDTAQVKRLQRAPYRVGDVIEKRKHLARLPENSVVTNSNGYPIIVDDDGWLTDIDGCRFRPDGDFPQYGPYTVRYIPED